LYKYTVKQCCSDSFAESQWPWIQFQVVNFSAFTGSHGESSSQLVRSHGSDTFESRASPAESYRCIKGYRTPSQEIDSQVGRLFPSLLGRKEVRRRQSKRLGDTFQLLANSRRIMVREKRTRNLDLAKVVVRSPNRLVSFCISSSSLATTKRRRTKCKHSAARGRYLDQMHNPSGRDQWHVCQFGFLTSEYFSHFTKNEHA
jgi:hypothetical protein